MIYSINNKLQTINNGKLCDYNIYYPKNWGLAVDIYGTESAGIAPFGSYLKSYNPPEFHTIANTIDAYGRTGTAQSVTELNSNYYYNAVKTAGENATVTNIPANAGHTTYLYYASLPTKYWSAVNTAVWNSPFYYPINFSGEYKLPKQLDIYVKTPTNAAPQVLVRVVDLTSAYRYSNTYDFWPLGSTALTGSATTAIQNFRIDINYPEVNNG